MAWLWVLCLSEDEIGGKLDWLWMAQEDVCLFPEQVSLVVFTDEALEAGLAGDHHWDSDYGAWNHGYRHNAGAQGGVVPEVTFLETIGGQKAGCSGRSKSGTEDNGVLAGVESLVPLNVVLNLLRCKIQRRFVKMDDLIIRCVDAAFLIYESAFDFLCPWNANVGIRWVGPVVTHSVIVIRSVNGEQQDSVGRLGAVNYIDFRIFPGDNIPIRNVVVDFPKSAD